jgi:hypothetical protein
MSNGKQLHSLDETRSLVAKGAISSGSNFFLGLLLGSLDSSGFGGLSSRSLSGLGGGSALSGSFCGRLGDSRSRLSDGGFGDGSNSLLDGLGGFGGRHIDGY